MDGPPHASSAALEGVLGQTAPPVAGRNRVYVSVLPMEKPVHVHVLPPADSSQASKFSIISEKPNPKSLCGSALFLGRSGASRWKSSAELRCLRSADSFLFCFSSPGCLFEDGLCRPSETCVNGKCAGPSYTQLWVWVCLDPADRGRGSPCGANVLGEVHFLQCSWRGLWS